MRQMRLARIVLSLLVALAACRAVARADFPSTQPFAGVTYRHEVRSNPPLHIHIVAIDLRNPRITLKVARADDDPDGDGPWTTVLRPSSAIARREGFDIAVNGDFFLGRDTRLVHGRQFRWFEGNWSRAVGPAMTDGVLWNAGEAENWYALVVHRTGRVSIGPARPLPQDAWQVVGGNRLVLDEGRPLPGDNVRHPRTAAGIDRDGAALTLVVVDGRRKGFSEGMTTAELGAEFQRLGCWKAINLDGGGSTTLVMRNPRTGTWHILNRPSDGSDLPLPLSIERAVCNVLGISIAADN